MRRLFRPPALIVLVFSLLPLAGCAVLRTGTVSGGGATPTAARDTGRPRSTPDSAAATVRLGTLVVAAPRSMAGYSRDRFPHWREVGAGCDTRDAVLKRDGTDLVVGADCHIATGRWYSAYDGRTWTEPAKLDIDHVVPLANAWRSGADSWTDARRADFANDLARPQLLAVTTTVNRAKGDQDPSQWKPPVRGFWCDYAVRWITVKSYYLLTVTAAEKAALSDMLAGCGRP